MMMSYPSTIIIFTINPDELEIKDITESDKSASYLALTPMAD
jgi:hypothetical protein